MARQKGQVSLRLTDTPSGQVCSIVYRGPLGKRTLQNLGFCDVGTPEGKKKCVDALNSIIAKRTRLEQASG